MGWEFPNAIAESVKRTAALRGQNHSRLELRDSGDRWPSTPRVSARELCQAAPARVRHEAPLIYQQWLERYFVDPFCRSCGGLVESG